MGVIEERAGVCQRFAPSWRCGCCCCGCCRMNDSTKASSCCRRSVTVTAAGLVCCGRAVYEHDNSRPLATHTAQGSRRSHRILRRTSQKPEPSPRESGGSRDGHGGVSAGSQWRPLLKGSSDRGRSGEVPNMRTFDVCSSYTIAGVSPAGGPGVASAVDLPPRVVSAVLASRWTRR